MKIFTADKSDDASAFDHVWSCLGQTPFPAYLTDPLCNIIGINQSMMDFHGLTDEIVTAALRSKMGANVLGMLFRRESILRQSMGDGWEPIVRSNLHQFRATALRYRNLAQFETLLSLLCERADFPRLWAETRLNPTNDFYSQLRRFEYKHMIFGPVFYVATMSTTVTSLGNLHLTTHVPLNAQTVALFMKLSNGDQSAREMMPWSSLVENPLQTVVNHL